MLTQNTVTLAVLLRQKCFNYSCSLVCMVPVVIWYKVGREEQELVLVQATRPLSAC